jgi:hypothetical protein
MIKEMETGRLILKILKLCTGVPTLCDFIFAYGHGYPQFGCLTEGLHTFLHLKTSNTISLNVYNNLSGKRSGQKNIRLFISNRMIQLSETNQCQKTMPEKNNKTILFIN